MTVGRSKRRSLLTLTFIVKSISKNLLIRKKRMYAKIEPHRARSVTYAILRNYKKKTAELKKKNSEKI